MARTPSFKRFSRLLLAALIPKERSSSALNTISQLADASTRPSSQPLSRRSFLRHTGVVGAVAATALLGGRTNLSHGASSSRPGVSVGIVGAGLAGLACADVLKQRGIYATVYEAAPRAGGRCWSLRGVFPGQVAERGGELIDNLHKTMLGYAHRFGLTKEAVNKLPGELFYHFYGQRYAEAAVVAEFRDFISIMRGDLNRLSREVTAASHSPYDETLDRTPLLAYLEGQNSLGVPAGPLAKSAIIEAYEAEYGLAAEEQSCLNFLLFIHADRRSKFTPFGVFSDERYHLVDGNDRIVEGLVAELPGQLRYETKLVRVRRTSGGRIELTFRQGSRTVVQTHDMAVLAIPFTVLRNVDLDPNLTVPPAQRAAIQSLGYGTNAKMMVGFSGRPWVTLGSTGASYADLPNSQATWETNPTLATATRGILTDYSSGPRGAGLNPNSVQTEAQRFLSDLNIVYPGALGAATRNGSDYLVHLEHWPSHPLSKGSYTCYRPGQFTTLAGLEGLPAGNLLFAGEHTNSFYEWQGFMEGAALSGIQAAKNILAVVT